MLFVTSAMIGFSAPAKLRRFGVQWFQCIIIINVGYCVPFFRRLLGTHAGISSFGVRVGADSTRSVLSAAETTNQIAGRWWE